MKTAAAFLMLLMMFVGVSVVGTNETSNSGYLVYTDPEYGIEVKYPDEWQGQSLTMEYRKLGAIQGSLDDSGSGESFYLIVQNLTLDLLLNDYTDLSMDQVRRLEGVEILESGNILLSGIPGFKVTYRTADMIRTKAWTVKDGMAYVISYSAFPENYDSKSLKNVIDSFRIG